MATGAELSSKYGGARQRASLGEFLIHNWLTVLIGLGLFGTYLYLRWQWYGAPPEPKGSSKMATAAEVLKAYGLAWGRGGYILGRLLPDDEAPVGLKLLNAAPSVPNAKRGEDDSIVRVPFEERTRHYITEAGTGEGKTSTEILPQVIEDGYSGVCNAFFVDRKPPEIAQKVGGAWHANGHRVIVFDPWQAGLCWGCEPVFGASPDRIRAMTEAHVQISFDPADTTRFYREQERAIIEALFICAQEWGKLDRRLATLPALAELVALGFETTKIAIQNARPDVNRRLADQWKLSDGDLAKLFRSIYSRLSVYLIPEVAAAFSRPDFTVEDVVVPFSRGKDDGLRTILIVGASQAKGAAGELIASFMSQLVMHAVYERGHEMKSAGARWTDTVPLSMWFDEIGTYQIGRFEDFLAVARDAGVAITSALQNRLQFDRINGKDASARLLANHGHKMFMRGINPDLAKELSTMIGTRWELDEGRTAQAGRTGMGATSGAGRQRRWVEREIMPASRIISMPKGQGLCFGTSTHPFMVELVAYYKSPRLLRITEESTRWAMEKSARNLRCDEEGVARPRLEVPRLETPVIDWTPVVGEEVMRGGGGGGGRSRKSPVAAAVFEAEPLTREQERIIRGKCRDLGITDINRWTRSVVGKVLKNIPRGSPERQDITKSEGARLLALLEEREKEFAEDTKLVM